MARKFVRISIGRMLRDWDRIDDEFLERTGGWRPPDPDRWHRQRHQEANATISRLKVETRAERLAVELVRAMLDEQASRPD